jgi:hypothetical protein
MWSRLRRPRRFSASLPLLEQVLDSADADVEVGEKLGDGDPLRLHCGPQFPVGGSGTPRVWTSVASRRRVRRGRRSSSRLDGPRCAERPRSRPGRGRAGFASRGCVGPGRGPPPSTAEGHRGLEHPHDNDQQDSGYAGHEAEGQQDGKNVNSANPRLNIRARP